MVDESAVNLSKIDVEYGWINILGSHSHFLTQPYSILDLAPKAELQIKLILADSEVLRNLIDDDSEVSGLDSLLVVLIGEIFLHVEDDAVCEYCYGDRHNIKYRYHQGRIIFREVSFFAPEFHEISGALGDQEHLGDWFADIRSVFE